MSRTLLLATFVLLLTGCEQEFLFNGVVRTYGGFETAEGTYEEAVAALEVSEADYQTAQANLAELERAADEHPILLYQAKLFAEAVARHELLLVKQAALVEDLDRDDYREVSRALGAIVTEQREARHVYSEIVERAQVLLIPEVDRVASLRSIEYKETIVDEATYYFIPPFYERVVNEREQGPIRFRSEVPYDNEESGVGDPLIQEGEPGDREIIESD